MKHVFRKTTTAFAALVVIVLITGGSGSISEDRSSASPGSALFTVERLIADRVFVTETIASSADLVDATSIRKIIVDRATGESAIADTSLLDTTNPGMWAAAQGYVDVSWTSTSGASSYAVSRDGQLIEIVEGTAYRDSAVTPGQTYRYRIEALGASTDGGGIWGFVAVVPSDSTGSSDDTHIEDSLREQVTALASYTYAVVQHQSFIPESRIDAPPIGCTYGSGYKFGGDNRGYGPSFYPYRTKLQARADFIGNGNVTLEARNIGTTTVYNSTGALVASATASNSGMSVERLAASSATSVDMRFTVDAANPFCEIGSIGAKFTITVTASGSWYISSGTHKQMPNHEVYLYSSAGGWVTAYQRNYANALCLVGSAICPNAPMAGYAGTY